jgi:hypothetical protein
MMRYEMSQEGQARLVLTANRIHVCDGEPSSYDDVFARAIASREYGAGRVFARVVRGVFVETRNVTMIAKKKGRPTYWAITTSDGLYSAGTIAPYANPVNTGDTLSLSPITIRAGDKFKAR